MAIIEIENLQKRYGNKVAVEDVSFSVEKGEIFGILGPNGAGKTTTVECMEGLLQRDGGTVRVLGMDPQSNSPALRERLGVQLQDGQLPDRLRVGEALNLYASLYSNPMDKEQLLKDLGLTEKRNSAYSNLSGGEKQRLSIALALIGNPEIAVLDELTTGLDPQARRDTWQLIESIRAKGVTIVLVTHFMDEAERLCDRLALIASGRVVALDTPRGLVSRLGNGQRMCFRPSAPLDERLLTALPEVTSVSTRDSQTVVTGCGNLIYAVIATLAARGIVTENLRVEQANLEDAFVTLTGHALAA